MFDRTRTLQGCRLDGLDGEMGSVTDFYFDDRHRAVRYLVAETGGWLGEQQVLISPYALGGVDRENRRIAVNLTKAQIEGSPSLETDRPVSRQFEQAYHGYYGWPMYWDGPLMWGAYPHLVQDRTAWCGPVQSTETWDPHLRSTKDLTGHRIVAIDGEIGHVEDFVVDEECWAIRYLIVDTTNWLGGKKVLIAPQWIDPAGWGDLSLSVHLTREAIQLSPEYTEASLLARVYETSLYRHYGRQGYWLDAPTADSVG